LYACFAVLDRVKGFLGVISEANKNLQLTAEVIKELGTTPVTVF